MVRKREHYKGLNIPPCNVGLNKLEHGEGGLVQANEHGVVDLTKAQQLKDLPWLGADTKDTEREIRGVFGSGKNLKHTRES